MNMNRISTPLLVAGTLLAGSAATQASASSAHAAKTTIARPDGTYSAGATRGRPYQSVLVKVDKTGNKVTVDQRCMLNVPGRTMTGTIKANHTFSVSGTGIAGHMTARGTFVDPTAGGHYLGAVHVTITNGCAAGSRTWDATLV
ncbi:MAG TPA: hypothetical protein VG165_10320 [Solirubrobacteraceae bacterium]|jgi:Cu/Ag efflux protein CusF|nr:hypothetical protein [Solirubrobacteraceae bacterium]